MSRELTTVKKTVLKTFADFGITMRVLRAHESINHIHLYLAPTTPVRMHEISGFLDDLRYALGRYVIKIEAPVLNKKEVKISVLKAERGEPLIWQQVHDNLVAQPTSTPLMVPLGSTETNDIVHFDLSAHSVVLVAGQTMSGKSNYLHGIINSLIIRNNPSHLRLMLVDLANVTFRPYAGLPHLFTDIISDSRRSLKALDWLHKEMERRYNILQAAKVDSIETYHRTVSPADRRSEPLPYIVLVIDEIADLMSEHGDFTEKLLRQLAIFSRGVGIHVILSTSSHEPRILRSMLRAHIYGVVCFATSSPAASEAFLYHAGAEALMGRGAALYTTIDTHVPAEIQTGLITESDIATTVLKVKRRYGAVDDQGLDLKTLADYHLTIFAFDDDDDLYEDAKKAVLEAGKASTSYLQRTLRIGYSRAARLIDLLEERGVIGPQDGSNPREILE